MEVEAYISGVAAEKGWKIQPDEKKCNTLLRIMKKRLVCETVICPCKVFVDGMVDVNDVKCPCNEAQSDIDSEGSCHCGMFLQAED